MTMDKDTYASASLQDGETRKPPPPPGFGNFPNDPWANSTYSSLFTEFRLPADFNLSNFGSTSKGLRPHSRTWTAGDERYIAPIQRPKKYEDTQSLSDYSYASMASTNLYTPSKTWPALNPNAKSYTPFGNFNWSGLKDIWKNTETGTSSETTKNNDGNSSVTSFSPFEKHRNSVSNNHYHGHETNFGSPENGFDLTSQLHENAAKTGYRPPRMRRRAPSCVECVFCKNNGQSEEVYRSHILKDPEGKIMCPTLRKYNCPLCNNGGGDKAHTIRYCPQNRPNSWRKQVEDGETIDTRM